MPDPKKNSWTIRSILAWTESYFKSHAIDSPRLTAEILLAFSLKITRLDLYLQHDRPFEQGELDRFKTLIKRRVNREPVAYITGSKGFFESDFTVSPDVLIPRPDTETLVEAAIRVLDEFSEKGRPAIVLDLGTGSGAIIVSLARKCLRHRFFATDASPAAALQARQNDRNITGGRVRFCSADWFSCLRAGPVFDLIVSNPPYIPSDHLKTLAPEIRQFEPIGALDGGRDGLDCYRVLVPGAAQYLKPGGTVLLEIGYDQDEGIRKIFQGCGGYQPVEFIKDLAGHTRVVSAKKR